MIIQLENLLPESEIVLIALVSQCFGQLRWPTVEHRHFSLLLGLHLLEHLVPVRSAGIRACLQTGDQVAFLLHRVLILI